jgi:AraC-like DNA-binding protein
MELLELRSEACHWHDSIEVVWVLRGNVCLYESNMKYLLKPGDIYVVNYNETHKMHAEGEDDALIASLYIDYEYFSKYIPNLKEISFAHYCFSNTPEPDEALKECRDYMRQIFEFVADETHMQHNWRQAEKLTAKFLEIIVDTFQYIYYVKENGHYMDILARNDMHPDQMRRLHHLTYYIYMNCQEKLTLDDIARTEFYSRFHVSHFIKKAFGLSYQETVTMSRAILSERLLIETDFNLDEIASMVGFSTRSQYCQQVRKWHDQSPSQYRKMNSPDAPDNQDVFSPVEYSAVKDIINKNEPG